MFELGQIGFTDTIIQAPPGRTSLSTRLDLRESHGVFLDVTADFDPATGLAMLTFTSLDPETFDLPVDPIAGFLPPNRSSPEGEGFVSYTIQPKAGLPTGTRLDAEARIVFDANEPIDTPTIFNTIDAGGPTSAVDPLPAVTTTEQFTVSWSGADDLGGSGIAFFDLFVSVDDGPFTPFLLSTTATSATFSGELERRYGFYSVATDIVGHRQATPTMPQARTLITPSACHDFNGDGRVGCILVLGKILQKAWVLIKRSRI